jgi:AmmeMemoRadiSam system protein B
MIARRPLYGNLFFYADEGRLRAIVQSSIEDASPSHIRGHIHALIVPHGTHLECGPIAGYAYKLLLTSPQTWDAVTLLAPQLQPPASTIGGALLLDPAEVYLTPLDATQVDRGLADQLRADGIAIQDAPDTEPILESHLPFVQTALGDVRVLPLRVSGSLSAADSQALARHAAQLGLIIAAGNLPEGQEQVVAHAIASMDIRALTGETAAHGQSRGGLAGLFSRAKPITPTPDLATIALVLTLAKARGATQVHQLFAAGQFAAFVVMGDA